MEFFFLELTNSPDFLHIDTFWKIDLKNDLQYFFFHKIRQKQKIYFCLNVLQFLMQTSTYVVIIKN